MITDEQAKATQEVAKTTGKFAEIADKIGGFIARMIGPASNQVGGVLEDWTRYFRYKNLLSIADKVEAIHQSREIQGKTTPISPRVAIPMLESASLEDDETLQDVWARLIANSADPNFSEKIHPGYIEIVKQMSPDEAIILESFTKQASFPILFIHQVPKVFEETRTSALARQIWGMRRDEASYVKIFEIYKGYCALLTLKKPDDSRVYIDNLIRLGIVELGQDFSSKDNTPNSFLRTAGRRSSPDDERPSVVIPARKEFLRMTAYGESFVAACIRKIGQTSENGAAKSENSISVSMDGATTTV